ncbi:MAG: hypothetical protein V5B38_23890 [Candidatus Accumulibacter propinquus]
MHERICLSAAIAESSDNRSDQAASALFFQRDAENRFSVGARDGNEFGHGLRVPA